MKLSSYRPVNRSDVPSAPDWVDKLREPDTDQIKRITIALQNQLGFSDNFNAEVRELDMVHNEWLTIGLRGLRGKVSGALVIDVDAAEDENVDWWPIRKSVVDLKTIRLKLKFASDPGRAVKVRVLILGS